VFTLPVYQGIDLFPQEQVNIKFAWKLGPYGFSPSCTVICINLKSWFHVKIGAMSGDWVSGFSP